MRHARSRGPSVPTAQLRTTSRVRGGRGWADSSTGRMPPRRSARRAGDGRERQRNEGGECVRRASPQEGTEETRRNRQLPQMHSAPSACQPPSPTTLGRATAEAAACVSHPVRGGLFPYGQDVPPSSAVVSFAAPSPLFPCWLPAVHFHDPPRHSRLIATVLIDPLAWPSSPGAMLRPPLSLSWPPSFLLSSCDHRPVSPLPPFPLSSGRERAHSPCARRPCSLSFSAARESQPYGCSSKIHCAPREVSLFSRLRARHMQRLSAKPPTGSGYPHLPLACQSVAILARGGSRSLNLSWSCPSPSV
mmetsp:Transcript_4335/g.13996  ORF Transcript_4335/g.13996 Transcript_4335/m.13996 type:complete len:304 (-) Transcript_4335:244-1155(-)